MTPKCAETMSNVNVVRLNSANGDDERNENHDDHSQPRIVQPDRMSFKTSYIQLGDNVLTAINTTFFASRLKVTISRTQTVYIPFHEFSSVQISLPDPLDNVTFFIADIKETGYQPIKRKLDYLLDAGGNMSLISMLRNLISSLSF